MRSRRAPDRPGPGPVPGRLLRALDLDVKRRIEGLLAGDASSVSLGHGTELSRVRPYEVGDDVRKIEWNVTARTGIPHVRVDVAERVPTVWVALDTSASMSFGTAERRKIDVAEGVCLAVEGLSARRGAPVGVAVLEASGVRLIPPARGRGRSRALWESIPEGTGSVDLAGAFLQMHARLRRRCVLFLVTDLMGPTEWRKPLTALASRHDVIVAEVRDPREDQLIDVGDLTLTDPESGAQVRVDTGSARLRADFEAAAAAERADVRRLVRASGADHLLLGTDGDWLRSLADHLRLRGRRR